MLEPAYHTQGTAPPSPITSYSSMSTQSSVILNCSSGMGLKLWTSIDRNLNASSQCGGTSLWIRSGRTESSANRSAPPIVAKRHSSHEPSREKSNNDGNSFPFGIFAPSARSSSKKGCTIASTALNRTSGVYSNNLETRSIASGAVRGRNTCVRR